MRRLTACCMFSFPNHENGELIIISRQLNVCIITLSPGGTRMYPHLGRTLAFINFMIGAEYIPPQVPTAVAQAVSPACSTVFLVGRYLVGMLFRGCCTAVTCGSSSMHMLTSFFQ